MSASLSHFIFCTTIWIEKLNCRRQQTRDSVQNVLEKWDKRLKANDGPVINWERERPRARHKVWAMKFLWEILVCAVNSVSGCLNGNKNYYSLSTTMNGTSTSITTTQPNCIYLLVRLKIADGKLQADIRCCVSVCMCQLDVHYYRFPCYFLDDDMIFIGANLCISISSKDRFIFYIKLSYVFVMAFCPLFCHSISVFRSIPQQALAGCSDSCNKCLENSCCIYEKNVYVWSNRALQCYNDNWAE